MSFSLIDEADCTTPTRRGVGANDSWHVFLPSDAMHTTVCYFGADIPGAGQVSSAQWNDFVEVSVRVIFNIHNTRSTGSCVVLQRRLQELNKLLTLSAGGQKHIATKLESFTLPLWTAKQVVPLAKKHDSSKKQKKTAGSGGNIIGGDGGEEGRSWRVLEE